jgi:hypothetical protein
MLLDIGVILGFYVLARLLPVFKVSRLAAALGIAVTVLALVDLASIGISGRSIVALAFPRHNDDADTSKTVAKSTTTATTAVVNRANGGSIRTPLGFGFVVAKESSLEREWISVQDPAVPVTFVATPGLASVYHRKDYGGEYRYRTQFVIKAAADIQALQVRFLAFDVWGEHMRTLDYEEVADVAAGATKPITGEWSLLSENDVERFYASIGYISRVRLKSGRVIAASEGPVVDEAKKWSAKFTAADLEPPKTSAPTR